SRARNARSTPRGARTTSRRHDSVLGAPKRRRSRQLQNAGRFDNVLARDSVCRARRAVATPGHVRTRAASRAASRAAARAATRPARRHPNRARGPITSSVSRHQFLWRAAVPTVVPERMRSTRRPLQRLVSGRRRRACQQVVGVDGLRRSVESDRPTITTASQPCFAPNALSFSKSVPRDQSIRSAEMWSIDTSTNRRSGFCVMSATSRRGFACMGWTGGLSRSAETNGPQAANNGTSGVPRARASWS
ncbi:MAG: hypothetical protein JWO86_1913, partial [Myxococcaceae bacterium]|nr:hypothetical protein [Myxococcaceae bacterium]